MTAKAKILVVEDEAPIREGLVDLLVFHGFEVDTAADGSSGLEAALSGGYSLVLLDVMLPGLDGFTICDKVRRSLPDQPLIMLTARSRDEDVINGLRLGADDYIAKPFSVTQLVLRVQAVLRRSTPTVSDQIIELIGACRIDPLNLAGEVDGTAVAFTRREMEVLQYLAAHAGRPVSREELLHRVWGYARDLQIETRTVDIHVAKIRRKIEADPSDPQRLVTVRGAGYRLEAVPATTA
ncbi:MAG: response regulator transcription factor [Pseudomonadota bacterium]